MSVTIAGHKLTRAQIDVLDLVIDTLKKRSGDSWWVEGANCSPKGDGRPIDVDEIFGKHSNRATAQRRTLRVLWEAGVLRACEVGFSAAGTGVAPDGIPSMHVKALPFAQITNLPVR